MTAMTRGRRPQGTPPKPTVASFYYPSQKHLTPTHCPHCGATLLRESVPTPDAPYVDIDCYLCSRTACELKHDSLRLRMTAEQWRALPNEQGKRGRPPKEVAL